MIKPGDLIVLGGVRTEGSKYTIWEGPHTCAHLKGAYFPMCSLGVAVSSAMKCIDGGSLIYVAISGRCGWVGAGNVRIVR